MKQDDIYSSRPAIYILYEVLKEPTHASQLEESFFRSSDFVVKIGRTRRNPLLRAREQGSMNKILKYWEVDLTVLNQCERELHKAFTATFNRVGDSKDTFYVVSFEKAVILAEGIVQKYQQND